MVVVAELINATDMLSQGGMEEAAVSSSMSYAKGNEDNRKSKTKGLARQVAGWKTRKRSRLNDGRKM